MNRFLSKIFLLFILLFVIDRIMGYGLSYITDNITIGGAGRDNYICNEVKDDILIFGSSRAEHHYNSQMITDSLGISCYNCGEGGTGVLLAYGRLLMILERYTPQHIIYEVTPSYDFLAGDDNHQYLYRLKPHYDREGVDSIFWDVDSSERLKMMSMMYRNNSSFLQNMAVFLLNESTETGIRGFRPYYTKFDPMKVKDVSNSPNDKNCNYKIDTLKLLYFKRFIEKTKDIHVTYVISPIWYGRDAMVLNPIKEICKQTGSRLIDFSDDPKYVHNNVWFTDGVHLNAKGADEFTRDLIEKLKNI